MKGIIAMLLGSTIHVDEVTGENHQVAGLQVQADCHFEDGRKVHIQKSQRGYHVKIECEKSDELYPGQLPPAIGEYEAGMRILTASHGNIEGTMTNAEFAKWCQELADGEAKRQRDEDISGYLSGLVK